MGQKDLFSRLPVHLPPNNFATPTSSRQQHHNYLPFPAEQHRRSGILLRKATSQLPLLPHSNGIATYDIHNSSTTIGDTFRALLELISSQPLCLCIRPSQYSSQNKSSRFVIIPLSSLYMLLLVKTSAYNLS
jgi:hypothetical protein